MIILKDEFVIGVLLTVYFVFVPGVINKRYKQRKHKQYQQHYLEIAEGKISHTQISEYDSEEF